jgi:hypothetical protein
MQSLSFDITETQRLFSEKKILDLRGISNRLMREASMQNNYAKAELSVIAYSLHKIETKSHFIHSPRWGIIKQSIIQHFQQAAQAAQTEHDQNFFEALKQIIRDIRKIDDELGNYAQNIYDKAKVKQASLAYSYGLSIAQSAALTGADQKELQSYIGFTTMHDEELEVKSISERVKELKELVGA